jgi:hypothetical protein
MHTHTHTHTQNMQQVNTELSNRMESLQAEVAYQVRKPMRLGVFAIRRLTAVWYMS